MDRLFRIDFYPSDWLVDTAELTPEECGLYIQIVMLIYAKRGPIDNDAAALARKLSNLSSRKCRVIVDKLVEKKFIRVTPDGKLTQKRAESELNMKRTHLELSAKGGRTRHDNERRNKENNDLGSTDTTFSVATPNPTPTATATEPDNPTRKSTEKNSGRVFELRSRVSEKAIFDAKRLHAPGWSEEYLLSHWSKYALSQEENSNPTHNASASFISWCKRNIRGKPPP